MPDVRDLLRDAAPMPARPFDPDDVGRRARRVRRGRAVAGAMASLVVALGVILAAATFTRPTVELAPADSLLGDWTPDPDALQLNAWIDPSLDDTTIRSIRDEMRSIPGVLRAELVADMIGRSPGGAGAGGEFRDPGPPVRADEPSSEAERLRREAEDLLTAAQDAQDLLAEAHEAAEREESFGVALHAQAADPAAFRVLTTWLRERPEVGEVEIAGCRRPDHFLDPDVDVLRARLGALSCSWDVVALAAGQEGGQPWALLATRRGDPFPFHPERSQPDTWCYGLTTSTTAQPLTCTFQHSDADGLAAVEWRPVGGPASPMVFSGRVPTATAVVEVVAGDIVLARLAAQDAGPAGRVAFGLLPPGTAPSWFVLRDVEGTELDRAPVPSDVP